jgi:hypothetical protein
MRDLRKLEKTKPQQAKIREVYNSFDIYEYFSCYISLCNENRGIRG